MVANYTLTVAFTSEVSNFIRFKMMQGQEGGDGRDGKDERNGRDERDERDGSVTILSHIDKLKYMFP